jgi:DivIVA domain-containing protein
VTLPAEVLDGDRPVRAEDLRRVRFPLAFRGYRMAEVDALLDRLAAQLDGGAPESERDVASEGRGDDGTD